MEVDSECVDMEMRDPRSIKGAVSGLSYGVALEWWRALFYSTAKTES